MEWICCCTPPRAQADQAAKEAAEANGNGKDKDAGDIAPGRAQAEADAKGVAVKRDIVPISDSEDEAPISKRRRVLQLSASDPPTPAASSSRGMQGSAQHTSAVKPAKAPPAVKASPAQRAKTQCVVSASAAGQAKPPVVAQAAAGRGKKATDLPMYSITLAEEYALATHDSVFFDNNINLPQMRSLVRYEGQLREKVAGLTPESDEHSQLTVTLKRFHLIESGIKIQRLSLTSAKARLI